MSKTKAIRLDDKGRVDDIAIECDWFRLERMDKDHWYAAAIVGNQYVKFSIYLDGKRIEVECYQDDIGCYDDTEEVMRQIKDGTLALTTSVE